jgi:hypothetical protein
MTLDSAGNIYVLGVSANANTNTGYVVVKYAPNGNQIWTARYDSTNYPTAAPTGFALGASNNIVVTGNALTVKFDAKGNLLWTAPYNGAAIAVDPGQNIYITGVLSNFTTMKFSPAGSNLWSQTWTNVGLPNISQAITVDSSSNVYVAGVTITSASRGFGFENAALLKYTAAGNPLWVNNINPGEGAPDVVGLLADSAGSTYVEVNIVGGPAGGYQTCKVNSDGTTVWYDNNPTGSVGSKAQGIALDHAGSLIVTGAYAYAYPFEYTYLTYKLSTNGSYIWTNFYPTTLSGSSTVTSVAVDQADSDYVTGYSTNAITGNDIATIKYDSNGNQGWLQRYDGPAHGNDAGNAIAVDNSGNIYVAGYETETNGFTSMILIKYSPIIGQMQSNGNFILHAAGSPGETFDIQASTNLQTWQDLGPITADTNGIILFEDTNALQFPARFYSTTPKQ